VSAPNSSLLQLGKSGISSNSHNCILPAFCTDGGIDSGRGWRNHGPTQRGRAMPGASNKKKSGKRWWKRMEGGGRGWWKAGPKLSWAARWGCFCDLHDTVSSRHAGTKALGCFQWLGLPMIDLSLAVPQVCSWASSGLGFQWLGLLTINLSLAVPQVCSWASSGLGNWGKLASSEAV